MPPPSTITVFSPALALYLLIVFTSLKFTFKQSTSMVCFVYVLVCLCYAIYYFSNVIPVVVIGSDLISYASIILSGIWAAYNTYNLNYSLRLLLLFFI